MVNPFDAVGAVTFLVRSGEALVMNASAWDKWKIPNTYASAVYDAKSRLLVFFEDKKDNISGRLS